MIGGSIPQELVPSVENGIKIQKDSGLKAGFPIIDFKATLLDGDFHEIDSNPLTFDIAARAAFRELTTKGTVLLLEPIMKVEAVTPEEYLGSVIGDLNSRRGHILRMDARGNEQVIFATAPMSAMFGFSHSLHAATHGRGRCALAYDHYEAVPDRNDDDPRFPGAAAMRVA